MNKKATIKDICRVTGLSLGTISKYLNGGTLKESNRKKVDQAIKELNYSVDEYARGFITNSTKTFGVVLPEFDNLFYARIASELEQISNGYGYSVTIRESRRDIDKELQCISWFVARRVDAIIVVPSSNNKETYEKILQTLTIPVVFLDQYIEGLNCEFVIVDNRKASQKSVEYLLDCGHRDIAIVAASEGVYTSDERVKGYFDAFAQKGIQPNHNLCFRVSENVDDAYNVIKNILQQNVCTALFACNFPNTYGAIFAVNELKIVVPEQLSLLGFDDMMFTRVYQPKLTIVDQPIHEIAQRCISRIMQLLQQKTYYYRVNTLACNFVVNQSTSVKN